MSHQLTIVVGHLGRDPEMKYTPTGTAVTSFTVAADRTFTKDGNKVKETIWFRVQCWGKQAEACDSYLRKGSLVYIEGALIPDEETGGPRVWTDKEGKSHAGFELNASAVKFLDSGGGSKQHKKIEEEDF